jgi:hypothetical protein
MKAACAGLKMFFRHSGARVSVNPESQYHDFDFEIPDQALCACPE